MSEQSQELILHCIDRGLSVLGQTGRAATLYMLETRYGLAREEFADIKLVTMGLRAIFGSGSHVLLKAIAEQLRSVSPDSAEVQASISEAAKVVEEAIYGVERGLG